MRPILRNPAGTMNKTEARYADCLELMKRAGEIIDWKFEPVKLKLAKRTSYTPDFLVVYPDRFELHEVKGHWEDDARVKIKVAQKQFPWFQFVAIQWKNKTWVFEMF